MVHQALSSIGEHQPLDNSIVPGIKHQEYTNGSLDHHSLNTAEPMSNGFISQEGSGKNKTPMPSELITSCVASWLMMQVKEIILSWTNESVI